MKYKSDAYEAIYEDATALYEIGAISEEKMREFNEMCLVQEGEPAYEAEKPADLVGSY
jgi:DNA-binding transcriptional regulator YiaG